MSLYRRPAGSDLRLHLNENTAGCSPAVLAAIQTLSREAIATYPDYAPVTARCEQWFGVPAGWVQLTNGLDEGLHLAAQAAAHLVPPDGGAGPSLSRRALFAEPAFEMYAACAEAAGLAVTRIQPDATLEFPVDGMLESLSPDTRLVYLTDPNNPTGLPLPAGAIERISEAAPHAVILVDEAYAEFSGRSCIGPLLDRRRHVIVGRTFAKAHGLAGLRVGALVAHPETLAATRRLQPPFSVNICAVRALEAALDDRAYLDWYVEQSVRSRQLIYEFCRRHALHAWPSEANFVLIRIGPDSQALVEALRARGIAVRDRSQAPGCAGCVRIAAGVAEHTERCLEALEDVLAARPR